jgi:hypothetical protein
MLGMTSSAGCATLPVPAAVSTFVEGDEVDAEEGVEGFAV